jgi:hypothetical protein
MTLHSLVGYLRGTYHSPSTSQCRAGPEHLGKVSTQCANIEHLDWMTNQTD